MRQRIGARAFATWFAAVTGQMQGDRLVLECPDDFVRDWLAARYGEVLREAAPEASEVEVYTKGRSAPARRSGPLPRATAPAEAESVVPELAGAEPVAIADPDFESFVAGPANALALEAARAISQGRSGRCNPLLLLGPTGVGKTHLCRAIRTATQGEVVYRSSEEFTSEVTQAIRGDRMPAVRQRYRRAANVLILEDVQFLQGKRATQSELFHTIDHLTTRGRPVVLSADRPLHEIDGLDPKLGSRISAGLIAHIGPPDCELRRAILRRKASGGGVRLPDACVELLCERPVESVRELVAGLNQVVARATLLRRSITPELVEEALAAVDVPGRRRSLEEITTVVAGVYSLSLDELRSRSRRRRISRPRQLAMFLCRSLTDASLAEIGRTFQRDHTSVVYAVSAVERRTVEQPQLRYELETLAAKLGARLPGAQSSPRRAAP